jgi:TonB family protein
MLVAMIVASVVVHLVLWPVGDRVMSMQWGRGAAIPVSTGVFEVSLVTDDPPPRDPDDPKPVHDPEHLVTPAGKLVQLDQIVDERPPEEETDLVAEFDSRTSKPTKAPSERRPVTPGDPGRPGPPGETSDGAPPTASAKSLPLGRVPNDEAGGQPLDAGPNGSLAPGTTGRAPVAGLSPRIGASGDWARETFGGPRSIDDIDDAEEGAGSVLNTDRWKYASFFNRVRNAIDDTWEPQEVHKAHDPDGRAFGTRTRHTQLIIRLNPDGSIRKIRLDKPSGAPHLDEEAIRATRAAAPFVNPPDGLVDPATGYIEFRFGFIFEFDGSRRIFRYKQ